MRALALSLAASALALSAALALAQDRAGNPFAGDAEAIAAGKAIYDTTCAACHGAGGLGGEGPPLNRPLARAADDAGLFRIIRDGIPETAMPAFPALSEENTWRVATYVRSLNALAPTPLTAAADVRAGEALFFGEGGCAACHEVSGRGGSLASDLSAAGLKTAAELRNALAHEPLPMRFVTVVTAQGARIGGFVQAEDLSTLHLRQRDGRLTMLSKSSLRGVSDAANPLPIAALDEKQRDDIVAFLSAQKGRDLAGTAKSAPEAVLPYARIATPEARNWVTHRGTLDGSNFSLLSAITAANVGQLQARWSARLGDGASAAAPLAVDGMLYASGAGGHAYAFDAQSGLPVWRFAPPGDPAVPGAHRGVALLDGRLFLGSGGKLVALDAHTGRALWERQTAAAADGYAMTGAPLALPGRILTGVAGEGTKARGWLDAYDPASGRQLWRIFATSPEAAGGMTAAPGAYPAGGGLLYWSTTRATDDGADGDSILAVNADRGTVAWRHKLAPGAGGDGVVLADQTAGGARQALLLHLGRDGLLTVLDRASGKPLRTHALTKARVESPALSFDRSSFVLYAGLGTEAAAVDARTGRVLWRAGLGARVAGVLATRGGVVFAALADGQLVALAAEGGKPLWRFRAGGAIAAAPVSYAAGGRQFIAVTAGNMVYAFALPG